MRDAEPLRISPAGAKDAHGPKELEELEGSHVVFRLREEKKKKRQTGCYFSGLCHIILCGLWVNVYAWIHILWLDHSNLASQMEHFLKHVDVSNSSIW